MGGQASSSIFLLWAHSSTHNSDQYFVLNITLFRLCKLTDDGIGADDSTIRVLTLVLKLFSQFYVSLSITKRFEKRR